MPRVAVVTSHPIQYQAPWFQALARECKKLLKVNSARDTAGRLKALAAIRPGDIGLAIPQNGEPRTKLSMGEHAALTALERAPNVVEPPADEELVTMCARCHTYARTALQRRDTDEWLKHSHFHLGQYPTAEYQAHGRDRNWWEIASEQLPPAPGHVDHAHGGGRHLPRGDDRGDLAQPLVRDRSHADVGLVRDGRVRGDLGAGACQRVEERRLARVRQAHDAGLERHGRRLAIYACTSRCCSEPIARCWSCFTAFSVLPRIAAASPFVKSKT